jgi:peroxiredoxin
MFLAAACGGANGSKGSLTLGAQAPQFTATDHQGKTVALAELHGKGPVVLTFLRSFY